MILNEEEGSTDRIAVLVYTCVRVCVRVRVLVVCVCVCARVCARVPVRVYGRTLESMCVYECPSVDVRVRVGWHIHGRRVEGGDGLISVVLLGPHGLRLWFNNFEVARSAREVWRVFAS